MSQLGGTTTEAHSKNTQRQTDLVCNICCATFDDKDAISTHIRRAHFGVMDEFMTKNMSDIVPVFIDLDKTCNNISGDEDNDEGYHVSDTTSQSVCNICNCIFKDNNDLDMHKSMAHPGVADEAIDIDISSDSESINYGNHDKSTENEGVNKVIAADEQNHIEVKKEKDSINFDRVICNICVEEFNSKATLTTHIKSVHFGISNYKCAMCSASFADKSQVIKHYNVCTASSDQEDGKELKKRIKSRHVSKSTLKKNKISIGIMKSSFDKSRLRNRKTVTKTLQCRLIKHDKRFRSIHKPRLRKKKNTSKLESSVISNTDKVGDENDDDKTSKEESNKLLKKKKVQKLPRPCFICRAKIPKHEGYRGHLLNHHQFDPFVTNNIDRNKATDIEFTFKCLRCGKVGPLLTIQSHLQTINNQNCVRMPFNGMKLLQDLYCTICGEKFEDVFSHDDHVASEHYSNVYKSGTNFASIPFPHILSYCAATDVCKHCTKTCHFTLQSCTSAERANRSFAACLVSPFVCPYDHISKHSRCTLELLLYHTKFCVKKAGTLALQCNNCFKMLLCNNTPRQIEQLREVVQMQFLECCENTTKTFKCYCCGKDFKWVDITEKLQESITILGIVNNPLTLDESKRSILQQHPTVHIKSKTAEKPAALCSELSFLQKATLNREESTLSVSRPKFKEISQGNFKYHKHVNRRKTTPNNNRLNVFLSGKYVRSNKMNNGIQITSKTLECNTEPNIFTRMQLVQHPKQNQTNMFKRMQRNAVLSQLVELSQTTELKAVELHKEQLQDEKRQVQLQSEPISYTGLSVSSKSTELRASVLQELKQHTAELRAAQQLGIEAPDNKSTSDSSLADDISVAPFQTTELHTAIPKMVTESWSAKSSVPESQTVIKAPLTKLEVVVQFQSTKNLTAEVQQDKSQSVKSPPVKSEPANSCLIKELSEPSKKTRTCHICARNPIQRPRVYTLESFVLHMMRHEAKAACSRKCWDCNTLYNQKQGWKQHILLSHPNCILLRCGADACDEEFQRPQDLQDHIRSEHIDTGFGCTVCLKHYSDESALLKHMQLHGVL